MGSCCGYRDFVPFDATMTMVIKLSFPDNEFQLKPPQYLSGQETPFHELISCSTSYHLRQTSANPQRAPDRPVQYNVSA